MPAESFSNDPVDTTMPSCPGSSPRHWIEIVLQDENGHRIAFSEYLVTTPSGERVRGFLDANGFVRLGDLSDAGSCSIQFPGIDGDMWSYRSSGPSEQIG